MDLDPAANLNVDPPPLVPPPPVDPTPNLNDLMIQLMAGMNALMTGHASLQQTAAAATAAARARFLPQGVRNPEVLNYDGKRSSDVRPWVNRTRNIMQLSGFNLNNQAAVCYAASFLTGAANSWFVTTSEHAPPGTKESAGFLTFDTFAAALIRHMGDPNPDDKARQLLRTLHQVTSVKSYADEFQRIVTDLPNRDAADLRFDFINGLKPKIRELLVGKTADMPWPDVRDLANNFDAHVMHSYRSNRDSHRDSRRDDPMELGAAATSRPANRPSTSSRGRSSTRPGTPAASRSSSPAPKPLPKLTEEMRQMLRRTNGCFRCQKPHAGHQARDCPGLSAAAARVKPTASKN